MRVVADRATPPGPARADLQAPAPRAVRTHRRHRLETTPDLVSHGAGPRIGRGDLARRDRRTGRVRRRRPRGALPAPRRSARRRPASNGRALRLVVRPFDRHPAAGALLHHIAGGGFLEGRHVAVPEPDPGTRPAAGAHEIGAPGAGVLPFDDDGLAVGLRTTKAEHDTRSSRSLRARCPRPQAHAGTPPVLSPYVLSFVRPGAGCCSRQQRRGGRNGKALHRNGCSQAEHQRHHGRGRSRRAPSGSAARSPTLRNKFASWRIG